MTKENHKKKYLKNQRDKTVTLLLFHFLVLTWITQAKKCNIEHAKKECKKCRILYIFFSFIPWIFNNFRALQKTSTSVNQSFNACVIANSSQCNCVWSPQLFIVYSWAFFLMLLKRHDVSWWRSAWGRWVNQFR